MTVYQWMVANDVAAIVGWVGTVSGLVGLVLTVAVYRSTSAIRREFLIGVRVPKQLRDLRACSSAISLHLNGADLDNTELRKEVAKAREIATSVGEKVTSRVALSEKLGHVAALSQQFEAARTKAALNDLWVHMQGTNEAVKQWLEDRDWSNRNGD